MKYKLIAMDLDGTLLNSKDEIGKKTILLIKKAIDLGVKFAMCSARAYLPTQYYNAQIDRNQPIITSNGGLITKDEKAIFSNPIVSQELVEIIKIARSDKEDIQYGFSYGNHLKNCIRTNIHRFIKYIDNEYNQMVSSEFRVDARLLEEPIGYIKKNSIESYILTFVDNDPLVLNKLKNKLNSLDKYEVTSSEANNIEITKKGVSKGNALKKLAKHYGYSLSECIAIGNDKNDLSMINEAGLGIAMKNSSSFIKGHANYVTEYDNDNEGVAEIIEKFIFI